jgi:hypothetical protein
VPSSTSTAILATSTQYIYVRIYASVNNSPYDPTIDPVAFCVVPKGTPPVTFSSAAWSPGADVPTARYLVGPLNGGQLLQPGRWDVYVQISTGSETPVLYSGELLVTLT